MEISLEAGEVVLRKGFGYHRFAFQSVVGTLWLTNQRLYYHSTPVTPYFHEISLSFTQMRSVAERNGLFGIDMGFTVVMGPEWKEHFVMPERKEWLRAIRLELERYR